MIVAGTGHRPDKLGGYTNQTRLALGGLATEYLVRVWPEKVISGMALGWDQALAAAAMSMNIPVIAAIPFEGQESRWPAESQALYRKLLGWCDEVEIISPHYSPKAMQDRNEWMVDQLVGPDDRLAALWNGSWGGTHNCITYARKHLRPDQIYNLWLRWSVPQDMRELLS